MKNTMIIDKTSKGVKGKIKNAKVCMKCECNDIGFCRKYMAWGNVVNVFKCEKIQKIRKVEEAKKVLKQSKIK